MGWPARRFLPLAGACGRQGFCAWVCACDSRYARVLAGVQGVARRGQKPQGRRQGRAFFPPFLWRSKERGRRGGGGAQPPRTGGGIPGVPHCGVGKTPVNDAARAQYCDTTRAVSRRGTRSIATRHATSLQTPESPPGQTLGGGRATFGPPLQHRLNQERNSQSPIFSIFSGHTLRDSTRLR